MAEILVDVTVICDECGDELTVSRKSSTGYLKIEPCDRCMADADSEGYERGLAEAEHE